MSGWLPVKPDEKYRILDFDIENAPRSYWVPDRPTADITAIASCWAGDTDSMQVLYLKPSFTAAEYEAQMVNILNRFVERYDEADLVTGHYIRKHDLPIINGALMDWQMPTLKPKLTQDTKLDMVKKQDIPATQEYLSEMLGLGEAKYHMTQHMWRDANRLTDTGLAQTIKRVSDDVLQHMHLRQAMLDAGLLHAPRIWRP